MPSVAERSPCDLEAGVSEESLIRGGGGASLVVHTREASLGETGTGGSWVQLWLGLCSAKILDTKEKEQRGF